ncbi:MAG: type II toxin-antitoxin system VapC family toxin [Bacteroidales bacterium]|jgi:predicted nucleic acid-binding protein|nr:type II toxin-antitoxin system VapC family toxin [Bacteroidales bacterium]
MEKKLYLVDTCVFISAIRGNADALKLINRFQGRLIFSVITEMELYVGAKTRERKREIAKQFSVYTRCDIDQAISLRALQLIKKYTSQKRQPQIPDMLIAATALTNDFTLVTYNTKDFDFVEQLKLE